MMTLNEAFKLVLDNICKNNVYDTENFDIFEAVIVLRDAVDKYNKYEQAIIDLAKKRPMYGDCYKTINSEGSLEDYINKLSKFVIELSSLDNIIISAVYERLKKDGQK